MRQEEQKREEATARAAKKRATGEEAKSQAASEGAQSPQLQPQLAQSPTAEKVGAQSAPLDESVVEALRAADDKKALDLVVLDVREIASFTDYFLITSGTSTRQVQAIADEVVDRLKKTGRRAARIEGYRHAEWVLIDFGDFVVHIFEDKARRFYDLERLWRDAARVSLPPELSGGADTTTTAGEQA
jgi:ribosome-associated protein